MDEEDNKDELDDSMESLPNYFLVNEEEDKNSSSNNRYTNNSYFNGPMSPATTIKKRPYIKLRVQARNLQNADNNGSRKKMLRPYCLMRLNDSEYKTKDIFHTSPNWREEFEFEISDEAKDKIIIEIYSKGVYENKDNKGYRNVNSSKEKETYIGFQILPINFLEKSNQIGITSSINLSLITTKLTDYFNEGSDSIMNIENHNPISYIIKDPNTPSPYLKLTFLYLNHQALSLINCSVYTLLERVDNSSSKKYMVYKLYIRRMDGLEWFKEASIEEIEEFRETLSTYSKDIKDIPFPEKSMFSHLPIIGRYYEEEEDNKSLKERINMINNFFLVVTKNLLLYSIEEFNDFFTETINM